MTLTKLSTRQPLAFPEGDYVDAEFLRNVYRAYKREKTIDSVELYHLAHSGSPLLSWSFPRVPDRIYRMLGD